MLRALLTLLIALALASTAASCGREIAGGRADGAAVFKEVCARCHGPAGKPDASMIARRGVKDLTSQAVQKRMTDDQIRAQIKNGSKNRQMPSFSGALTADQMTAIVAYVRTLAVRPPSRAAEPAPPTP